jgi:hypothetical protein
MRAKTLGVALLAFGCGQAEKPARTSANGGQSVAGESTGTAGSAVSGNGGSNGGAATAGSAAGGSSEPGGSVSSIGVVLGDTPAEACIAYAWASCSRANQCRAVNGINCTSATLGCPDLLFSPGATRTPQILKECAQVYAALPCEQVRTGALPACVTSGTRARGEECIHASQCTSISCTAASGCGTCGVRANEGDSCAGGDVECPVGIKCNSDTLRCENPVFPPTPADGEACIPGSSCQFDSFCKEDGLGGATCTAKGKANDSCAQAPCSFGTYCGPDLVCKQTPALGQACGFEGSGLSGCDGRFQCQVAPGANSGTCVPLPKAGEPCVQLAGKPESGYCNAPDASLHCDQSTTPPLCKEPGKAGDACVTINDCRGLAACECADATLSACPVKHCIELHVANQPCTAPSTRCHPAFECTAGVCQPLTLRGDFTAACGP